MIEKFHSMTPGNTSQLSRDCEMVIWREKTIHDELVIFVFFPVALVRQHVTGSLSLRGDAPRGGDCGEILWK